MLSDKEMVGVIQALWEALQEPKWTKDDMIDFGKAIFSKQKFKEMDDKTFKKIWPFIETIATSMSEKLSRLPPPAQVKGEEKVHEESHE